MELRQLTYFLAVAEERHFGRAARKLKITQPQLSQHIRQLEQQMGVKLFERTTRRVDLTAAGHLLLDRGRAIVDEVDEVRAEVYQAGSGVTGTLRIGMVGSAAYTVMPGIVRASGEAYPDLKLELHGEMLSPELEKALVDGDLDAAVVRSPPAGPEVGFRIIGREPLMVAVPARGPLGRDGTLTAGDLRDERFVSYPPGTAIHRLTQQICRGAGFECRVAQVVRELSAALCLVAAGTGVAVVPVGARVVRMAGVRFCELVGAPETELALVWRRGDYSHLVANFVELVTALEATEVSAPEAP